MSDAEDNNVENPNTATKAVLKKIRTIQFPL
jgi:hypothetical protein